MLYRFIIVTCLVFCFGPAQESYAQGAGLSFLKLGTDASGLGAGSTHTSFSSGAFSTYWNPAGLASGSQNSAGLTYNAWLADLRVLTVAARFGMSETSGLGLALTATTSGDLEAREVPGDPSGFFNAQFVSVGASYARAFGPLRLGLTAKYLSERIFEVSANGYAFDFGMQWDLVGDQLQLGVSAQHFGSMNELEIEATDLPRTVRAGVSIKGFRIMTETTEPLLDTRLMVEVVRGIEEEETSFHIGLEGEILEVIKVRGGYFTNDDLRRFSAGAGLLYESFQFDYAFLPFRAGFGTGQVLTLLYFF